MMKELVSDLPRSRLPQKYKDDAVRDLRSAYKNVRSVERALPSGECKAFLMTALQQMGWSVRYLASEASSESQESLW
jgi:hypothetical protein